MADMIKIVNLPSFDASLDNVADFCRQNMDSGVTIVVPDKLSLFMEKHLFESLEMKASFNLKVSTLDRLVKKDFAIDKSQQLSKLGCIILVHKILVDNFDKLKLLRNKAYSFSYAEEIFNTIAQLKASKITYEEMERFECANLQLQDKIKDLALIYQQYETLKAGLLDVTDQFLVCCMGLKDKYKNQNFLFVGYDDFTAIEYTAIECLAYFNNVSIVNYYAKSSNQHIYNNEVASQLKQIAYTCNLPIEIENPILNQAGLKPFLRSNIYGLKQNVFEDENNQIKILSCRDSREEIEQIAREIRQKVLAGANFKQFGVACFAFEKNAEKFEEIFSKYEINFYLDNPLNLSQSVLFKFVCDIFRNNVENYELSHLIDIINSPFFCLEETAKQALILKLMQIDFKGNLSKKIDLGELNLARDNLIEFLAYFDFKDDNITQIKQKFSLAFDNLKFADVLTNLASETSLFNKQILLTKSIESVQNVFDEIEKFYPAAGLNELADVFMHVGEVTKISNLPLTLDAVKIVDANNFCEMFDNLYLSGCTVENAPAFKNDCGIIVDSEIEQLNFSHKLAPTIGHINKLARLRVFNASLLFDNSLTITYSRTPSELIKEFCTKIIKTFNNQKVYLKPTSNFDGQYVALSNQDYIEKNLKYNTDLSSQFVEAKRIQELSKENASKITIDTISASRLEDYFKCPLHHFLNYTLKVRERLQNDIMPVDTGNILHQILFEYYSKNKQVGDLYQFAKNQIFAIIEKDDRLKINAKSPVLTNLIDETVRVLNGVDYIDQNCNFKPTKFEFAFYDKSALNLGNAKLVGKIDRVDTDGQNLRIIDYKTGRAEASLKELYYGNKLQLFLYACAMENVSKKSVVGEFYLPLHNAYTTDKHNYALKGFFENTETNVINLDNRLSPGDKSDIVNITMAKNNLARRFGDKELLSTEMKLLKEYSKKVSSQAIEEIKSGYIEPTPTGVNNPCESCPYSQICLKDCRAITERKPANISTQSFEEVEQ